MKIALCSSFMPFIRGGGRNIVDWLASTLTEAGHEVEVVYLPELDSPPSILFQQMMALRWIDLQAADRIICFRPQAHLIPHPHKILWFIHHIRTFYDLWDSPYRDFPDTAQNRAIRESLFDVDTRAMGEAKTIFSNSKVVSDRLKTYNGVDSEVLYPPVFEPERFSVPATTTKSCTSAGWSITSVSTCLSKPSAIPKPRFACVFWEQAQARTTELHFNKKSRRAM
jgi:hypothetical protein